MANKGREFLRDLKMKEQLDSFDKERSLFPLSDKDKEIDSVNGIERNPTLGCIVSVLGTILVWSLIYWIWVSL
jgi:hypothetical protein